MDRRLRGLQAFQTYLLAHLSQRIDTEIALGYHHHLLGLPLDFFWNRRTGEILSRSGDATRVRAAASGTSLSIIVDALMLARISHELSATAPDPSASAAFRFVGLLDVQFKYASVALRARALL